MFCCTSGSSTEAVKGVRQGGNKMKKRIKVLRLELKKSEGQRMDVDTFLETVRRYHPAHHHLL